MLRKIVLAATASTLVLGGIAAISDSAGAAKPTITATGSVHCDITGKVKIDPPLKSTNTTPSTVSGKLKGVCTGTTQEGVTPSKVKIALTYTGSGPGTCSGLAEPNTDPFTLNLTWKGSGGKINPTVATLKGFVLTGIPDFGFNLPNPASSPPQSSATGSYAGTNNGSAHAHIDIPDTTKCDPTTNNGKTKPPKGIKKIPILAGSYFDIN